MKEALRKDNATAKNPKFFFFFLNLHSPGESQINSETSVLFITHSQKVCLNLRLLRVHYKPHEMNNNVSLGADYIHTRFLQNVKYDSYELIPLVCNLLMKTAVIIKGLEGN